MQKIIITNKQKFEKILENIKKILKLFQINLFGMKKVLLFDIKNL